MFIYCSKIIRLKWGILMSKIVSQHTNICLDIVGTVYHLVIYMESNKIHRVC